MRFPRTLAFLVVWAASILGATVLPVAQIAQTMLILGALSVVCALYIRWGVGQLTSSFHFGYYGRRRFLALVYAGTVVYCVGAALLRGNFLGAGSTAVMFAVGLAIYLHPKVYARELVGALRDALPLGFPTEPLKRHN